MLKDVWTGTVAERCFGDLGQDNGIAVTDHGVGVLQEHVQGPRLALRILYPETNCVAELSGVRVIEADQPLSLGNLWKYLGARVDNSSNSVAKGFSWTIDGAQKATTPDLSINLSEGAHSLTFTYQDFRGRSYSFQSLVKVLSPAEFAQRMASQSVIIGASAN